MSEDLYSPCPVYAPFYGYMGVCCAFGLSQVGSLHALLMSIKYNRGPFPILISCLMALLGIIMSLVIQGNILSPQNGVIVYSAYTGYGHLLAGLVCGLSSLMTGLAIGWIVKKSESKEAGAEATLISPQNEAHATLIGTEAHEALVKLDERPASLSAREKWCIAVAGIFGGLGFLFAWAMAMNMYVCPEQGDAAA